MNFIVKLIGAASIVVFASASVHQSSAQTYHRRTFVEAALFFMTGVDATGAEKVTVTEIVLHREPPVVYLVFAGACGSHKSPRQRSATAIMNTTPSAA